MARLVVRYPFRLVALSSGLALMQPVAGVAHPQATNPTARASSRCTSDWMPRPLSSRPESDGYAGKAFLGSPSAARVRAGLYVVGSALPQAAAGAGVPSALLIGPGGTALPLPAGADRGQLFRIAVAEPDSIYLLWGASGPSADSARRRPNASPTEVWFSSRIGDTGWTVPERLFTALTIGWDDAQVPEIVRDRAGAFHLAFAGERAWGHATLVLVTMRRGVASVATTELRGVAGYVTAAPAPDGMLVAFVAPDFVKERNANSVFVIGADDTGFLHPARLVMSSPGEEQAVALRAIATANAVHLVWIELRGQDADPLLRHTVSRDGGTRWSPWTDAAYTGTPHITAMPDGRDGVNVLYTIWTRSGPSHSEVMCWDGGWEGPVRLGAGLRLLDPHPVVGRATRPSLVATAIVPGRALPTYRVTWLERAAAQPCTAGRRDVPCRK